MGRKKDRITLFEDERLRIRFEEGDSDEAVVSFSGVGLQDYRVRGLDGLSGAAEMDNAESQIDEFRKTVDGAKNVYYVADLRRNWYNQIDAKIFDIINAHIAGHGTTRVMALGNSMGGTGALLFAAGLSQCTRAVAFAPQSAMHPDFVPFETRWQSYQNTITEWTVPDPIAAMRGRPLYYIFYGMNEPLDELHVKRIIALGLPKVIIFGIVDCGHDVALYLRKKGIVLKDILAQADQGNPHTVRAVIKDVRHKVFRLARH